MSSITTFDDDASRNETAFEYNENYGADEEIATQPSDDSEGEDLLNSPPAKAGPSAATLAAIASPKANRPPLEAAITVLNHFAQTLLWSNSSSACRELGTAFLQLYSSWYHKKIGLVDATNNANFVSRSCAVSVSLQPCERAKEGSAALALAAEAASVVKEMKITLSKFCVRMDTINNDCKKEDLTDSLATALPAIAKGVLIEVGAEAYGPHNLVADMLMLHHIELVRPHEPLTFFASRYKRLNDCCSDPEDSNALYEQRFLTKLPPETGIPETSAQQKADESSEAIALAQGAPPSSTTDKSLSDPTNRVLFQLVESLKIPTTNLQTRVEPSPPTNAPPTPATTDVLQNALFGLLAIAQKDSPAVASLVKANPLLATAATTGSTLLGSATNAINLTGASPPRANKPKKILSPPQMKWDPYNKRAFFSRKHTPEEIEELCNAVTETDRKLACENEVIINSIREKSFVAPSKFDTLDFAPNSASADIEDSTTLSDKLPMEAAIKIFGDKNLSCKIEEAAHSLWERVEAIFIKCPSAFINQHIYNKRANDLSAFDKERRMTASASATVAQLSKEPPVTAKTVKNAVTTAVTKAKSDLKRKHQSSQEQILQRLQKVESGLEKETRKRLKAEAQAKKERAEKEKLAKELRGLAEGASQRNPIELESPPPPHSNTNTSTTQASAGSETVNVPSLGGKPTRKQLKKQRVKARKALENAKKAAAAAQEQDSDEEPLRKSKVRFSKTVSMRGRGRGRGSSTARR